MITERQLNVFYTVCKYMNMTKASEELFVSQPAISKTIQDIEAEYNVKLFERQNRNLILTPQGFTLLEDARQILGLMEAVDKRLLTKNNKELIRVGASITLGTSILCWIVSDYLSFHNDVQIEALVDNTNIIEKNLLDGNLDFAFVEGRTASPDITSEIVSNIDIVLVVNKQHRLYDKADITINDLNGEDFIVREKGSRTRENFTTAMERKGIRWNPAWSCHNTQAIKNAVDAGLGIGVLSSLSVRKRLENGRFKSLNVFDEPLKIYIKLAYKNDKYFSSKMEEFKEYALLRFSQIENACT